MPVKDPCFLHFRTPVTDIRLPERFTYPFNYVPHELAKIASTEVQQIIADKADWNHDFGIDTFVDATNVGKMFGVLVVENNCGELGYLAAFSGKVGDCNIHHPFVPPIFDALDPNGFFKKGETEISAINTLIREKEDDPDYVHAKNNLKAVVLQADAEISDAKREMKEAKRVRDQKRSHAKQRITDGEFSLFFETLKNESLKYQYDYKELVKKWERKKEKASATFNLLHKEIDSLKKRRKEMSGQLQQQLFDQYHFLNSKGETRSLCSIFSETVFKVPPGGAGDCAAPKLLQYAFENKYKPIALAEFWWGQPPVSAIRKHGYFYPSCRGKCFPILSFMLEGLPIDPDPIEVQNNQFDLPIVFEDEHLIVVNKPAEMLSVPGKSSAQSVYSHICAIRPEITGPVMVHRLDMSTSGLLVLAKNKDVHEILQHQFQDKSVQKQYVALLDGTVKGSDGEISLSMKPDILDRPRQVVCQGGGKPSLTKWEVVCLVDNKTLVRFIPVTGRTHQLRVHSAHQNGLNAPIVGDDLYGKRADRLYLHAEYLSFIHPASNKRVEFAVTADFDWRGQKV